MEELIKYYESVESRLAALDARISELLMRVEVLEEAAEHEAEQEARIAELLVRVEALEAAANQKEEDEVEVELVFNEEEEEEPEEPESPEEPEEFAVEEEEPVEEPVAEDEPVVEEPAVAEEPEVEEPAVAEEPVKAEAAPRMGAVTDLRKAISLGDRFLFVRELFGNNGEKFQHAIDALDKLSSLSEANDYIERFGWDKESKAYELFQNALKRRFA